MYPTSGNAAGKTGLFVAALSYVRWTHGTRSRTNEELHIFVCKDEVGAEIFDRTCRCVRDTITKQEMEMS